MKMRAQRKDRRGDLIPGIATVIVAVVGTAGILLNDFGAGNVSQGGGNARMITTAVVSRAGATEIPSEPARRAAIVRRRGSLHMKKLYVVCVALCVGVSTTAAFARGGMGSHHASVTGGAFGTSAAVPGTNSSGTALSSSGIGDRPMSGPSLGTNPAIDREEAKVDKMIGSICRGC